MSSNGNKIELPGSIVVRDLAQKIGKSPIDLIKKLMSNGVMATINQSVDFDTPPSLWGNTASRRCRRSLMTRYWKPARCRSGAR
jgi:hypothetical protein